MKTFESLYRDYYQKVYAFLNRMCADGDLAEGVRFLPGLRQLASIPISNI